MLTFLTYGLITLVNVNITCPIGLKYNVFHKEMFYLD